MYVRIALPEDGDAHHPHHAGKPGKPQQVIVFQSYLQAAYSDEDGEVGLPGEIRRRRAEPVVIPMQIAWGGGRRDDNCESGSSYLQEADFGALGYRFNVPYFVCPVI